MIKRLIFDIDNTIITGVDFKIHIEKALREYGINDLEKLKIYLNNIKEYRKVLGALQSSYLIKLNKKLKVKGEVPENVDIYKQVVDESKLKMYDKESWVETVWNKPTITVTRRF